MLVVPSVVVPVVVSPLLVSPPSVLEESPLDEVEPPVSVLVDDESTSVVGALVSVVVLPSLVLVLVLVSVPLAVSPLSLVVGNASMGGGDVPTGGP